MIVRDTEGPQAWNGVHVTHKTTVAELINVDNVGPDGTLLTGFEMFRQAGESLDEIIRQARDAEQRVLAIGSGWALSKINITDGRLVNTKLLNGCYDIDERYFDGSYPAADRRCVVLAQAGMQIAELNAFLELTPPDVRDKRALKAAGIGNGQTIAGAVSGNTHGSQLDFGAMPDFVVGLHIATGSGRTLWIEKASKPVLNEEFADRIGAEVIRDDDVFLGRRPRRRAAVPIALTGRTVCRVDATSEPIDFGDLLTTSALTGHAMKATVREAAFGAALGKALASDATASLRSRCWCRFNDGPDPQAAPVSASSGTATSCLPSCFTSNTSLAIAR